MTSIPINPPARNRRGWHNLQRARRYDPAADMWTGYQWRVLCALHRWRCACCGALAPLTADHVLALSAGGSNDISNIQPLCAPCNTAKDATFADYRDPYHLACFLACVQASRRPLEQLELDRPYHAGAILPVTYTDLIAMFGLSLDQPI